MKTVCAEKFSGVRVTELEVVLAAVVLTRPDLEAKYEAAIADLASFRAHCQCLSVIVDDTADGRLAVAAALATFQGGVL
jgi:hypothetical protein